MNTLLTVIIPFRNEGIEVYNTLNSIRSNAGENIDIILINDASNDQYDYKSVANIFQTEYIEHKERRGVAASRNEGVKFCKTPFFIFLDAHMRSFTPNWASIVIQEVQKDLNAIFCCQTISIDKKGEVINTDVKGLGVYLDFDNLSYQWNYKDFSQDQSVSIIPCIMGASYISNVKYWNKLRGLEGLCNYGYDEQLISIKTLLEGGNCKIIKKVLFGHIFRTINEVPYQIDVESFVYNQLYIIELFYPQSRKISFFQMLRSKFPKEIFEKALEMIIQKREHISNIKQYYKCILTKDFDDLVKLNQKYLEANASK